MTGIIITILVFCLAFYALWTYYIEPNKHKALKTDKKEGIAAVCIAAGIAFIARIILAAVYNGHDTDMSCFIAWSNAAFEHGLTEFYKLDMFHDYPPGYIYVLYVIGALQKLFGFSGGAQYVLIKLPAIICDIAIAAVIYKIASKKLSGAFSTAIAAIYLFNPAAILNCSLWGQVDSVYVLLVLLMVYFITENKMPASYFMFALAIFVKPQAFIFTPLLIGGIIENVFLNDYSRERLIKNLLWGLGAIAALVLIALPFGLGSVIEQYKATLSSYQYLTVNAFNIWGAFGKNWKGLTSFTTLIGYIILAAIVVYSLYFILKSKDKSKYYFAGALLAFLTYMFSTKMHERYAFPAVVLLIAAFALTLNRSDFWLSALITLSQFFNMAWVLFIYQADPNKYFTSPVVMAASWVNILITAYLVYRGHTLYVKDGLTAAEKVQKKQTNKTAPVSYAKKAKNTAKKGITAVKTRIEKSDAFSKITRFDVIAMVVITVVYSCVALYDLGDMHAPETEYMVSDGEAVLDLGRDYEIGGYKFFLGSYELNESNRPLVVTLRDSAGNVSYSETLTSGSVFRWNEKDCTAKARYMSLSTTGTELSVKEIAVLDSDKNVITPVSATPSAASALYDEQQEIPERSTFRNGTYFDEIYHARTAYEFTEGLSVYEWTHPPLGKVIIVIGIKIFGMNPFGWRIAGTVFGIFMIPIIYLFAKSLLKKSWLAILTCLLLTFDFMHFAQTRIATIDVYVTFFIMLMYYFMYRYYSTSFYDTSFKKGLKYLALCGISMGLGIASKWTGMYAGAGLAVIFIISVYKRYREYIYAVNNPKGETNGISHKFIAESFKPYLIKTVLWCCVFFIVVPAIIYVLAYIPYLNAPDEHGLKSIIDNQRSMYTYHSKTVLGSTHPYSSRWYEWIIMKRPIWYYSGTVSDGIKEGISSFGNPLVWWMGIPAFVYMVYRIFKNRDKNALFLVIAYMAQLLPWVAVTRLTFIYHYFPCVPFIVLMIGYSIKTIYDYAADKTLSIAGRSVSGGKAVFYGAIVYVALVIVLFMMFYPVLAGHACSMDYAKMFLKWFDSWVLL